jgi:signal peptidase II
MKKYFLFLISAFVVILDQFTKTIVRDSITLGETIKITEKFFWFTNVRNYGAAFSISFGNITVNKIVFISVTAIAVVLIFYLFKKSKSKIERTAFALIMGGAVGNLIDRVMYGYVTDFIWWDFPDFIMQRWPVFNIADSSIVLAITLLIIYSILLGRMNTEVK